MRCACVTVVQTCALPILSALRRPNDHELSLLARLVRTGVAAPNRMWSAEVRAIAGPDRPALIRAEQAASLAGIGRAIYDALLESMFEREDKRPISSRHPEHLVDIVDIQGATARNHEEIGRDTGRERGSPNG